MKRLVQVLLVLLVFWVLGVRVGWAKETELKNKKGVHILFPYEIEAAAEIVGENGWVVVPMNMNDWDKLDVWQDFFQKAAQLKVRVIVRLVTYPKGGVWAKPGLIDAIDWANFLSLLDWQDEEKWVIIFNEPNHAKEWGGMIEPEYYAMILKEFAIKLKAKNLGFKVLPAAMDMAAGNTKETVSAWLYWEGVWKKLGNEFYALVDGWNAHAYPNPAFSAKPQLDKKNNIVSYRWEIKWWERYFKREWDKPVFITETGWSNKLLTDKRRMEYAYYAWDKVWQKDDRVISVNWFLLNGWPGPFADFSLMQDLKLNSMGEFWQSLK